MYTKPLRTINVFDLPTKGIADSQFHPDRPA